MNKTQLLEHLESIGMRPGRGLGQNFLIDGNLLEAIVRAAAPQPGEQILEVGPGFGALTRLLLATGAKVTAIEYDHRLADHLRKTIDNENFTLVEADACKVDFTTLFPDGTPFRAIANLPYSISSIFIARMLELPELPRQMIFMLQKEMAERLAAPIGTKAYGALSVRTQMMYDTRIIRNVPPEVFFPPPEVDSAVEAFDLRPGELPDLRFRRRAAGVIKTAFAQRRKQLGKVLGACYGKEKVLQVFATLGIAPEIRPDRVTVEDFMRITEGLFE